MSEKGESKDQILSFSMDNLDADLPWSGGHKVLDHSGLVNVLKDKLQTLVGRSLRYIESLPPKIKKRVEAFQELQDQHDELEVKFFEEKAAWEGKYQKLYEPFYGKRCEIMNGMTELESAKEDKTEPDPEQENDVEIKGVPDFWLKAMKNEDALEAQITERDEDALQSI
eukprot:Gb_16427 [translate_table: standard]